MEKENKLKIFHVQGWEEYSNWIPNAIPVNSIEEADVVFFLGGSDVSPKLYGSNRHPTTYIDEGRDKEEVAIYNEAIGKGKKLLGVCRGSQFLCAMQPGGMLVQHQPNPGSHDMITEDGKVLRVSSTHHQAQYPFNMRKGDYKILGWTKGMLKFHKDGDDKELAPEKECEVVYYPNTKALAIQPHPEMMSYNCETNVWMRDVLHKFLENKL